MRFKGLISMFLGNVTKAKGLCPRMLVAPYKSQKRLLSISCPSNCNYSNMQNQNKNKPYESGPSVTGPVQNLDHLDLDSQEQHFEFSEQTLNADGDHGNWKEQILNTMTIFKNFITAEEETDLLGEIEPYLSRLHYESSHWDDAINHYRETERSSWKKKNEVIIDRIRGVFPKDVPQLKLVHVLDLEAKGVIKPHIDSVRFCGNTIAGLSLLSDSIMKLRHDVHKDIFCKVYLPQRSLYIMKNIVRYEFTHEILGNEESVFKGVPVVKERRISIVCRNEPEKSESPSSLSTFHIPEEKS